MHCCRQDCTWQDKCTKVPAQNVIACTSTISSEPACSFIRCTHLHRWERYSLHRWGWLISATRHKCSAPCPRPSAQFQATGNPVYRNPQTIFGLRCCKINHETLLLLDASQPESPLLLSAYTGINGLLPAATLRASPPSNVV